MIDHLTLKVQDIPKAKAFYVAALAPLGYELAMEFPEGLGFGVAGKPDFWLAAEDSPQPQHVAFRAPDRAAVDGFHAAALAAGGRDNGAPGLRPHYHPNYYGAFVFDPSGHNMEAVCHEPPAAARRKAPARKAAPRKAAAKGARKVVKAPARKARRR